MSRRPCERHREALADIAERRESSPAGAAAIAHVGRCPECAELLGDLMLTVIALRRMAGEPAGAAMTTSDALALAPGAAMTPDGAAVADTTWTRLRARIERSRQAAREQAWRWRTSLGGMLASALVVATLVGPATLHFGSGGVDIIGGSAAELDAISWQIEADYVAGAHAGTISDASLDAASAVSSFRRYPDDLRPTRKEVAPVRSAGLAPDAR